MAFEQESNESISQINITPFVDVMLVLLIIFMVTAPILQQGVNVDLPQVTVGPLTGKDEQLVVIVTREGKVQLNDSPLKVEELQKKLAAILQVRPDREVYLRADKNVPYGKVVEVMAAARNAGVRKLGMVTEPLKDER
ncbi:MAG TPA: protein TolR [Candidatus Binatia bacterium]|jgi:biopolymer transport protein TolR|nr:protein TolR [Candidatus Binatia bacterium]